jgi:hypothetical protein
VTESDIASSMRVSVLTSSQSLPSMRQTSTGTTTTTTTTNTSFRDRKSGGLSSSASSVRPGSVLRIRMLLLRVAVLLVLVMRCDRRMEEEGCHLRG